MKNHGVFFYANFQKGGLTLWPSSEQKKNKGCTVMINHHLRNDKTFPVSSALIILIYLSASIKTANFSTTARTADNERKHCIAKQIKDSESRKRVVSNGFG